MALGVVARRRYRASNVASNEAEPAGEGRGTEPAGAKVAS